jgi:hypothetical protein
MWYTIKYDGQDALMFFDNTSRSVHFASDESNLLHQAYLAWVAEGNTAEEWSSDGS